MQDKQIDFRPAAPRSAGAVAGMSILALLLCGVEVFWLSMSVLMPFPCIMMAMIVTVALWEKAGPVPGCIMAVGSLLVGLWYGPASLAFTLLGQVVPAGLILYSFKKELPFDKVLKRGALAALIGVAVAILFTVTLYGRSVIADTAQDMYARATSDEMAPMMRLIWQNSMARTGATGLSYEDFLSAMEGTFSVFVHYYQIYLAANLLTGALLSAILATFWGSWIMAKQGRVTAETFKGLADWKMPTDLAIGLVLMVVVGGLLGMTPLQGIRKANAIVQSVSTLLFTIAAFQQMDYSARERGQSVSRRKLRIVIYIIAGILGSGLFGSIGLFEIMAIFGCIGVFFSKDGPARKWMEKQKQ